MGITAGDTVAVQGLGGLGHLAVQYARKMGYRTVALSTSSNKKDFAEQLGATDYIDTSKEDAAEALQKMGGASLIVVTAPNPQVMGPLVNGLGPLGKLLILARKFSSLLVPHHYTRFGALNIVSQLWVRFLSIRYHLSWVAGLSMDGPRATRSTAKKRLILRRSRE